MNNLRLCFLEGGKKELVKSEENFFLVSQGKANKRISEKEALREYLDPTSFSRKPRPHELFPNLCHQIGVKWDPTESVGTYKIQGIEFKVSSNSENTKLEIISGKLTPKIRRGLKL